jgi:hypothetical protein
MKTAYVILIILAVCIASFLYYCLKPSWDFGHLEQKAHSSITGTELQAWATNLLAHPPVDADPSLSELGTNFPQQLRQLAPRIGPRIYIRALATNEPAFVQISWGSGMMGGTGFYIGSTNFAYFGMNNVTDYTESNDDWYIHVWQPGVWFYRDNGR